jgi:hypothetical protein
MQRTLTFRKYWRILYAPLSTGSLESVYSLMLEYGDGGGVSWNRPSIWRPSMSPCSEPDPLGVMNSGNSTEALDADLKDARADVLD